MYGFVILLLFNEMQMSVRRFSAIPHLRDNSKGLCSHGNVWREPQSSRNNDFQFIHSLFNTYVVLLISDIDIKGSD